MATLLESSAYVEVLYHEFPIHEANGQTLFPDPESGMPRLYLKKDDCYYGVEVSHDDNIESLRDKLTASNEELERAWQAKQQAR